MAHQAKVFFLVAGLSWVPALASAHADIDIDELMKAQSDLQRVTLKHGHHLRRSGHPGPVFLKYKHDLHHRHEFETEAGLEAELDADVQGLPGAAEGAPQPSSMPRLPAMTLPGRHPAVEKALDGMSGDLESLRDQKLAAKVARGQLEGTVIDAAQHINDAARIKHAIAEKESQVRAQSSKLKALESDAAKLDQTREGLSSSLRRMLEPRMMSAQARFKKRETVLRKEDNTAKAWKGKKDQLKVTAMAVIKQRKASYQSLLDAEAEVAKAKKKNEMARIQYEHDAADTAEMVQSYRYAETRFKAEAQHEEVAKAATLAARDSVQKLHNVANVEQEKVDQSISYRKERLHRKMQAVEMAREKSNNELSILIENYRQWQEQQRKRTAEVVKKSQETATASVAYASRQQEVLDSAQAKAAHAAEGADDWDGWGSDFTKTEDENDE